LLSLPIIPFIIKEKDKNGLLFSLWIFWWYVCFSYIFGYQGSFSKYGNYYGIYVVPPFCLFIVLTLNKLRDKLKFLPTLILIIITIYQIILSFNIKTPYIPNIYEEAAKFVAQNPKGTTTLVSAYYDGNFIFHVRRHDPKRRMIILRADKTLVSLAVFKRFGVYSHVYDENDIYNILQDYGTGYIVVEDKDLIGIKAFKMLRKILNSRNFTLIRHIKLKDTKKYSFIPSRIRGLSLLIYSYNNITPPRVNNLVIKFPHMRKEIRVPFEVIVGNKKCY